MESLVEYVTRCDLKKKKLKQIIFAVRKPHVNRKIHEIYFHFIVQYTEEYEMFTFFKIWKSVAL